MGPREERPEAGAEEVRGFADKTTASARQMQASIASTGRDKPEVIG